MCIFFFLPSSFITGISSSRTKSTTVSRESDLSKGSIFREYRTSVRPFWLFSLPLDFFFFALSCRIFSLFLFVNFCVIGSKDWKRIWGESDDIGLFFIEMSFTHWSATKLTESTTKFALSSVRGLETPLLTLEIFLGVSSFSLEFLSSTLISATFAFFSRNLLWLFFTFLVLLDLPTLSVGRTTFPDCIVCALKNLFLLGFILWFFCWPPDVLFTTSRLLLVSLFEDVLTAESSIPFFSSATDFLLVPPNLLEYVLNPLEENKFVSSPA